MKLLTRTSIYFALLLLLIFGACMYVFYAELQHLIREVLEEQQIAAPFSIGKLMGPVMQKVAGRADGAAVRTEVQKFIESS